MPTNLELHRQNKQLREKILTREAEIRALEKNEPKKIGMKFLKFPDHETLVYGEHKIRKVLSQPVITDNNMIVVVVEVDL